MASVQSGKYQVRPSLAGRVALITGASSGIGEATAHVFAGAGAKLVLNGRDAKKLDAVVAAIKQHTPSAQIVTQIGSVDKEETHVQLVTLAINRFGALHVAFNNAGVFTFVDLKGSTAANIDSQVDINFKGMVYALKHQLPAIGEALKVRVNSIAPGATLSQGALATFSTFPPGSFPKMSINEPTSPEDIARFVLFVASNNTGHFFNGAILLQDGGGTRM